MTIEEITRKHITEGIREIYAAQVDIVDLHLYREGRERNVKLRNNYREIQNRSGAMRQALYNPKFTVGDAQAIATIPLQLRFFDMKHLGNWRVYNRQVWGILYGHTLREIKYEWRQQIADRIREGMEMASRQ